MLDIGMPGTFILIPKQNPPPGVPGRVLRMMDLGGEF